MPAAPAIIYGAAALGAAGISAYSQNRAAETQARAAEQAGNFQWAQYLMQRADLAPWRKAGSEAVKTLLGKIQEGPGIYRKSPYYNFLLGEGNKRIQREASAKGLVQSGAEKKALMKYGQNLASTDYDNWLDRWYQSLTPWQSLAGLGQTSAGQTADLNALMAGRVGGYMTQGGQAQAAGYLGQGNTWANLLGWGGQQAGNYLLMNRYGTIGGPASGSAMVGYGADVGYGGFPGQAWPGSMYGFADAYGG